MAKQRIRRLLDDEILYTYDAAAPSISDFGGEWGDSSKVVHEAMPQEDVDELARQDMWRRVRQARDVKLAADVDEARNYMLWAEAAGAAWDSQKKADWAAYRQALCDVPSSIQAQIDDPQDALEDIKDLDLDNYNWPTKPAM